jgi:hypothetical protein
MIEYGDLEFLKQAHRFGIFQGFDEEINRAILMLEEKGLVPQALAWRRKFAELRSEGSSDSTRRRERAEG